MKAQIQHIVILIHYRLPGASSDYEHILEFKDHHCGLMLSETRVGHHTADWTDYRSAKKTFYTVSVDEGVLLPKCLSFELYEAVLESSKSICLNDHSLFEPAWLLAQTFTTATKSVYTMSSDDLP